MRRTTLCLVVVEGKGEAGEEGEEEQSEERQGKEEGRRQGRVEIATWNIGQKEATRSVGGR